MYSHTIRRLSNIAVIAALALILTCGMLAVSGQKVYAEMDMEGAEQIKLGTSYTGTAENSLLELEKYEKTFKFTTTGNDSFYRATLANSTYKHALVIGVYDGEGVRVDDERKVTEHDRRSITLKLSRNTTYYVTVAAETHLDATGQYVLKVEELGDDYPDSSADAKTISPGTTYSGILEDTKDEDWFKYTAAANGYHTVSVTNTGTEWVDVDFLDDGPAIITEMTVNKDQREQKKILMKKGQLLYIRIKPDIRADGNTYKMLLEAPAASEDTTAQEQTDSSDDPSGTVPSELSVAKPAKVTISSAKAGKRCLTVKYKKAKRADKYQIAVRKAGGSWKYYKTTKLSRKFTKLTKGKKYTVKVRGIRVVNGKEYYGAWSKTKTVKVK